MTIELTVEALKAAKFKGPTRFMDGRNGMARQDFQCVDEPRFGYFWRRENRKDRGRQAYMVDGAEVADLDEACRLLALPRSAETPDAIERREIDDFKASPKLDYGATRALSEARCNADCGPFAGNRAWMQRAGTPWHGGVNAFADAQRTAEQPWPHWLYNTKTAAYELFRSQYLFAADREKGTGLRCELGTTCRDCPILKAVEENMTAARASKPFSYDLDDADIDAAKAWTCIGHILTEKQNGFIDGAFWSTAEDRRDSRYGF